MINSKKGQITVFIIVGVLIVVSFSAVMFVATRTQEEITEQEQLLSVENIMQASNVRNVIQACLTNAATDGLQFIAKQGGYIWPGQYVSESVLQWDVVTTAGIVNQGNPLADGVTYQLFRPDDALVESGSGYPCRVQYCDTKEIAPGVLWDVCIPESDSGLVGLDCYKSYSHETEGFLYGKKGFRENRYDPDLCRITEVRGTYECPCSAGICRGSIQEQLEVYAEQWVKGCLDRMDFAPYEIEYEEPNVNVTIAKRNVLFDMEMPFLFSIKGEDKTADVASRVTVPARILDMHRIVFDAAEGILAKEIDDIEYGITDVRQWMIDEGYFGLTIKKKDIGEDSLIVINDTQNRVGGEHYAFQFAVENRRPALDYVSHRPQTNAAGEITHDVFLIAGDDIVLKPFAVDPDDDDLVYRYSGWKANTDSEWDPVTREQSSIVLVGGNQWHESQLYRGGSQAGETCDTVRCAMITTTDQDVGEHHVVITVEDQHGLGDLQAVNIFVYDRAQLIFGVQNRVPSIANVYPLYLYSDYVAGYASIEDPFNFDVSQTTSVFGLPLEFEWSFTGPAGFTEIGDVVTVGSEDIKDDPVSSNFRFVDNYGGRIEATDRSTIPETTVAENFVVDVKECVVNTRLNTPAWPFNEKRGLDIVDGITSESNPFLADHSCCAGERKTYCEFDGSRIVVEDRDNINNMEVTERTIVVRFKADSTSSGMIYAEGDGDRGLNIFLKGGEIRGGAWNDIETESDWSGDWVSESINAGEWYHVALVLKDATNTVEDDKLLLYVNGILADKDDGAIVYPHDKVIIGGNDETRVGVKITLRMEGRRLRRGFGPDIKTSPQPFDGQIDDVRIYNSALSLKQIKALAHDVKSDIGGDLVTHWGMESEKDRVNNLGTGIVSCTTEDPKPDEWGFKRGYCYYLEDYGTYNDLLARRSPQQYNIEDGSAEPEWDTSSLTNPINTDVDRIYKRVFTRSCGSRGNACTGAVEQTVEFVETCEQYLSRVGADQRFTNAARQCWEADYGSEPRCAPKPENTPCGGGRICGVGDCASSS